MQGMQQTQARQLEYVKRRLGELHINREEAWMERSEGVACYEEHVRAGGTPVSPVEGRVVRRMQRESQARARQEWREMTSAACSRLRGEGQRAARIADVLEAYALKGKKIAEAARELGMSRQLAHRMFGTALYTVWDIAREKGLFAGFLHL